MTVYSNAAACGVIMLVAATAACMGTALAQELPEGYPESYAETIEKAKEEGRLLIYSSTDSENIVGLLEGFKTKYPEISIDYLDLSSNDVYTRLTSEQAAGVPTADLAWGGAATASAMVVAGLAETYETPEKKYLLTDAIWKDAAFSITIEPVVMVYNKRVAGESTMPATHEELAKLLNESVEVSQLATLDPGRSGAAVAYGMGDEEQGADAYWNLVRAMGKAQTLLYSSTSSIVEKVASGEHAMAYNVSGSTAAKAVLSNPDTLGMVKFCDYSLHLVRAMMIPAGAAHKNAAKLFLDYALSKEGQTILTKTPFGSIREDVKSEPILAMNEGCDDARVLMSAGEGSLRPFDETERTVFLAGWQSAFEGK